MTTTSLSFKDANKGSKDCIKSGIGANGGL